MNKSQYADSLSKLDDVSFTKETEKIIWLSAYANNNPRSDFHWQADACYSEAVHRGKPELYRLAWHVASGIPRDEE